MESVRDLKKYYVGEYEGKKLSLQEKKKEVAKEQLQKIKQEKQSEFKNQMVSIGVGILLMLMISYFVISILYH